MTNRVMVLILALAGFIGLTALMGLNAFLPLIAEDLDTSVSVVGQVNTATFVFGALIGLLLGPLADHFGLRRTIVAASLVLALSGFATAMSFDYWTLLLSRIPTGLGALAAVGIAIASTRLPESERRRAIGWIVSAMPLSAIVGVPGFALIAHYSHWRLAFVALGLVALVMAGLLWRTVPADPPLPESRFRPLSVLTAYRPLLTYPPSVLLYLADIMRGLTWFGLLIYAAAFFVDGLGYTLQGFATFMFFGGLAYLLGTRVGGGSIERVSLGTLFYGSSVIMGLSGALAFATVLADAAIIGLLIIFGFMGGVGFPAITIMISEASRAGQGTTMMFRQAGINASQAAGAAAGGALLAAGGFPLLGVGLGGFALIATVAVLLAARTEEHAAREPVLASEDQPA